MNNKLEKLIDLLNRFPGGASLEELMLGMEWPVSRRTLQRWLAHLVQEGRVKTLGEARARRYQALFLPKEQTFSRKTSPIHLSEEAIRLVSKVQQPIQRRRPVSYHREFLENYIPNQTFYLSQSLRNKLMQLGKAGDEPLPAGTYAKQMFHRLLIDLSWNSCRLEGNTYSFLETERLLDEGAFAEGKKLQETQMILNHKAAIEFLISSAESIGITRYTVLNLHTLLSDNLLGDSEACGRLRLYPVGIEKSVYLPLAIPQVIEECFDLIIRKCNEITDPFESAFFLMVHLPYLQPFDDVNKRTSRLAANIPFIQNNLSPLSFIDVPQEDYINGLLGVYECNQIELLRDVFVWAYERSAALYSIVQKSLGEPDPMRLQYRESIHEIVRKIILSRMNKTDAVQHIRGIAKQKIDPSDQQKWIEIVERELLTLHEGNIARYHIHPLEFQQWQKVWF